MVYVTGNIPIGDYDPNRLANLGLGHSAVDIGGGYTYLPLPGLHTTSRIRTLHTKMGRTPISVSE